MQRDQILTNTDNGLDIFKYFIPDLSKNGVDKNFRAYFRNDGKNADANVYLNNKGIWYYKDFASDEHLSPFDFVMKATNCDFKSSLEFIEKEILFTGNVSKNNNYSTQVKNIKIRNSENYDYWYNVANKDTIASILQKYNVLSLTQYSYEKDNKTKQYSSTEDNPIFAFSISPNCYKLYRPFDKLKHSWLGSKPTHYKNLFGVEQLPEFCKTILIVEGYKDLIVASSYGLTVVCVDNASTTICDNDIKNLKSKCKHVVLLFDSDEAGKKGSEKNAKLHNLLSVTIPKELLGAGTDITDYFTANNSVDTLIKLIDDSINTSANRKKSKFEIVEDFISNNFLIRYNEVSNQLEYKSKLNDTSCYEILNDNNIYRLLQHNNIGFSQANLRALLCSDFVGKYNPFLSYFESLPTWDSQNDKDFIDELCNYIPISKEDEQRMRVQLKKTLVRCVACSIDDNIINKHAFILIHSEQNTGKTTFIRWLCPPELHNYIAENISTDKDSLIAICENFIINMDELATLSKTEINSLKSILSKNVVKVRRPYDKNASFSPRRANFFGSTNQTEFLNDETGNVRWICLELTGRLNFNYNKDINIDDIWRQAYSLYKSGFQYELTINEVNENEAVNSRYIERTLEFEMIQSLFLPGDKDNYDTFLTSSDILKTLKEQVNTHISVKQIGKALKMLGFKRESKRIDSDKISKVYYIKRKN